MPTEFCVVRAITRENPSRGLSDQFTAQFITVYLFSLLSVLADEFSSTSIIFIRTLAVSLKLWVLDLQNTHA